MSLPRSPARTVTVDRERVRQFALAVADPRPECRDLDAARAAGHPDLLAPPTYPTVFALSDPELSLASLLPQGAYLVHGEQEYLLRAPLHAGDRITVQVAVEGVRRRSGGGFETAIYTLAENGVNQHGHEVYQGRSVVLARTPLREEQP
jgi:acyl dehydratase